MKEASIFEPISFVKGNYLGVFKNGVPAQVIFSTQNPQGFHRKHEPELKDIIAKIALL